MISVIAVCILLSACAAEGTPSSKATARPAVPTSTSAPQGSNQSTASRRLALPGPPLTKLQPLLGTWQTQMTVRQTPTSTPVVSASITTTWQWVVSNCYVKEEMTGQLGEIPYYRLGYLTYNNLDERYEFITMDTFDTGFMTYQSVGATDPGNTITLYGHFTEGGLGPTLEGKEINIRYVFHWDDQNHMSEEIYFTRPAGAEYLAIQYIFTRQKQEKTHLLVSDKES